MVSVDQAYMVGHMKNADGSINNKNVVLSAACETEQRKASKILCFWNARNWKSRLQGIGNPDCKKLEVRNAKK